MEFYHGHLVVAATFLLNFVAIGQFNSAALYVVPLEETFTDAGRGTIDFLPTIYMAVALFTSMGAGWLQDTLQKSRIRIEPIFGVGSICLGIGGITSSYGHHLSGVLSGAIITGTGIGLTGFASAGVCVLWFQKDRGTMLLLAMAGQGMGGFIYCNVIQQLLNYYEDNDAENEESWRPVMRISAVFSMIVAIVASAFMRLPNEGEVEAHYAKGHNSHRDKKGIDYDTDTQSTAGSLEGHHHRDSDSDISRRSADALHLLHEYWEDPLERGKTAEEIQRLFQKYPPSNVVADENEELLVGETTPLHPTNTMEQGYEGTTQQQHKMSYQQQTSVESIATMLFLRRIGYSGPAHFCNVQDSSLAEMEALAHMSVNLVKLHDDNAATVSALEATKQQQQESALPAFYEEPIAGLPYLSTSQAFFTRTSLSLLGWCFFSCFAYINLVVHLPAFAKSVGLSPEVGAGALSLTGLTMLLGNITLGRATDMVGPIRILQITMTILMVVFFAWPYATDATSLTILACLFGYAATTQGSVPLIVMADAFDSTSPDSILTLLGILNFAKFPGYLFGPTICGWLYDWYGDYYNASIFTGTIMLIG